MTSFKLRILIVSLLSAFVFSIVNAHAQTNRGKATLAIKGGVIAIDYGRPILNGRQLEGGLIEKLQPGGYWRMGMNEVTTFSSPVDLTFGQVKVPKGEYSLFLKRTSTDAYSLIFNTQTGQWGTEHDLSRDLAPVAARTSKLDRPVDRFTIEFRREERPSQLTLTGVGGGGPRCEIVLTWGHVQIVIPFTCPN